MKFELNAVEVENMDKLIRSFITNYGEPDKLTSTFSFTPTGIGTKVELRLESELFSAIKDITDYNSW